MRLKSSKGSLVADEVLDVGVIIPALALAVDQEIGFGLFVVIDNGAVAVFVIVHLAVELPGLVFENVIKLALGDVPVFNISSGFGGDDRRLG